MHALFPSIQVLLSNGILVTFTVAKHSGDVERVLIDKTLVTKLLATADNGRINAHVQECIHIHVCTVESGYQAQIAIKCTFADRLIPSSLI